MPTFWDPAQKRSRTDTFLVADEMGSLDGLKSRIPHKSFHNIGFPMLCPGMKKTKLIDVLYVLETKENRVTIPRDIATNAKMAID